MSATEGKTGEILRLADLEDMDEVVRLERFIAAHPEGTAFHRPAWFVAAAQSTGNSALAVIQEKHGNIQVFVPLNIIRSPIFGRSLVSSGFAVRGGVLADGEIDLSKFYKFIEKVASDNSCSSIELRGGLFPSITDRWSLQSASHVNFARQLADSDEQQLLDIPRKQRAEIRRSFKMDLTVEVGRAERDRAAHYSVFCESYRNLGTPVFPRALLDGILDAFGENADILTVRSGDHPVSSVLSVYHKGAVMPYWGGGTMGARHLRANDRMYYELMLHARKRGATQFDFGRSKIMSGAYHYKKTWGFEPEPLTYAVWTASGNAKRDVSPNNALFSLPIKIWQRLPLALANRLGPLIARGIG